VISPEELEPYFSSGGIGLHEKQPIITVQPRLLTEKSFQGDWHAVLQESLFLQQTPFPMGVLA